MARVATSDRGETTSSTALRHQYKSDAMCVWQGPRSNDTTLTAPLASVSYSKKANAASRQAKPTASGGSDSSGGLLYEIQKIVKVLTFPSHLPHPFWLESRLGAFNRDVITTDYPSLTAFPFSFFFLQM